MAAQKISHYVTDYTLIQKPCPYKKLAIDTEYLVQHFTDTKMKS